MQFTSSRQWALFLALFATAGFSLKAIFTKLAFPYGVDTVTLVLLRMLFSMPMFWFLAIHFSRKRMRDGKNAPVTRPTLRDIAAFTLLGTFGYYGASMLDFSGLQYISSGLERLILFTYPTLILLINWIFHRRAIRSNEWGALPICYLGIALAFMHDIGESTDSGSIWWGSFLVFASSLSFAIYLSNCGKLIEKFGSIHFSAWCMSASAILVLIHYLIVQPHAFLNIQLPWQVYGYAFAMAFFSTVLPIVCMNEAIRHLGSSTASLTGMIGPMLTIFLGWWWLSEAISWQSIAGSVLVILGIWLATKP